MERVSKEFASDLPQLAAIRAFVRQECVRAWCRGVSAETTPPTADEAQKGEEALARLELALGEAAANIILHAYRGQGGRPIEVRVEAAPEQVCVWLFHEGEGFDPQSAPPPVFDGSHETGFGLYLIRQCVDEVEYCRDERGRHGVRLLKKR
ncbi:MAG: ATP-binding protein [Gemmataceae bacterium]|nr:ATP-binding protein [Gemmataceae bacterium]